MSMNVLRSLKAASYRLITLNDDSIEEVRKLMSSSKRKATHERLDAFW